MISPATDLRQELKHGGPKRSYQMSYFVEQRLSSAIYDLENAEQCLLSNDIGLAKRSIEEAIRKLRQANKAVEGKQIICN
jgi:hypothetical protein